MLMKLM